MLDQYSDSMEEAIEVLNDLVREFNKGQPDVRTVLRRCVYSAHLIGATAFEKVFHWHINGFPEDQDLPNSRIISGTSHWKSQAHVYSTHDSYGSQADRELGMRAAPRKEIRVNLDQIINWSETGMVSRSMGVESERLKVTRYRSGTSYQDWVTIYSWDLYPAQNFEFMANLFREQAYTWAMKTLVRIKYENRVSSIWNEYRKVVDRKIEEMNLNDHLAAIDIQVGSNNAEQWRSALYSCRNLLHDVAAYLWKVPGDRTSVPGSEDKPIVLKVTEDRYTNRLMAYLYNKAKNNDERGISLKEAEYLGEIMERLYSLDNHGHASTSKAIVESAALHTYVLLADLIRLTDMEPLTEIGSL